MKINFQNYGNFSIPGVGCLSVDSTSSLDLTVSVPTVSASPAADTGSLPFSPFSKSARLTILSETPSSPHSNIMKPNLSSLEEHKSSDTEFEAILCRD